MKRQPQSLLNADKQKLDSMNLTILIVSILLIILSLIQFGSNCYSVYLLTLHHNALAIVSVIIQYIVSIVSFACGVVGCISVRGSNYEMPLSMTSIVLYL